jgi:putative ABC transport system permease protein
MTSLPLELRQAARALLRAPLFTSVAILTLGLGTGANAAVFSVVREVLLRPLPLEEPERLVIVEPFPVTNPDAPLEFSYPNFTDTRAAATGFTAMAAYPTTRPRHVLESGDAAQTVEVSWVSGDFFSMLGVGAAIGRAITPDDDVANAPRVAVLSNSTWQGRFGGERDVVGRTIRLNGWSHTIVGVMPPRVEFPANVEIWTALRPQLEGIADNRALGFLTVIGRLASGVTHERAAGEVDRIVARLAAEFTPEYEIGASIETLGDALFGPARPVLLLLSGAAGLVLLIACANVASLMLARAASSRRELAVRAALGASRVRQAMQPLLQSLILALCGTALGVWLTWVALRALSTRMPDEFYRSGDISIDGVVLAFSAAVALVAAALFGLAPTVRSSGEAMAVRSTVRATAGVPARQLSRAIMGAQLALATIVLIGGALLVRSFVALNRVDSGFADNATLTMSVFLPPTAAQGQAQVAGFYDRAIDRIRGIPGVVDAAGVLLRPLEGPDGYDYPFTIEGRTAEEQAAYPFLNYEAVTPGWFSTMGIPLLAGRPFETGDNADAPGVVIISRAIATQFFRDTDPVGQRIKWGGPDSPSPWLTIVGIAGEARYRDLRETSLDVYVPYRQTTWSLNHLAVRTDVPPASVIGAVRDAIRDVEPAASAVQIATMEDLVHRSLGRARFNTILLGTFAAIAVLLAAAGVFGVIGYLTAWRISEVGVRMAVGATPRDIRWLILGDAVRVAAAGIAVGLAVALAAASIVRDLLFGVGERDLLTFVGVAVGLAGLALLASWWPARRAMKVEPLVALRLE